MKTFNLEDIKSKVDIVDFISDYVQLKKSGQNWKGICPFHPEKTPSFLVSESKQIFHCFGCGAGGDVIGFISRYENLSFQEAVRLLAKRAGVELVSNGINKKAVEKDAQIRAVLDEAGDYFVKSLRGATTAKEYFEKRGVSGELIDQFRLGYAPAGWYNLVKHLRRSGYPDAIIRDAGLAVSGDKGLYDMFRNRIIFPITGASGTVLAFGGRALDDSVPKYINSPETPVFKKSDNLYGLSAAKEEIRRSKSVLIVEGYMDVITCHQYGFRNAVAPLGTALTPGHIRKLRSLADRAVLVFDGDPAGKAAARRALSVICQNSYTAKILSLPDNQDPDSYLRERGSSAFGSLLDKSKKTMIDFIFSASPDEKIGMVKEALALIAEVQDALTADEMLVELADRSRMQETTLREELRRLKGKSKVRKPVTGSLDSTPKNNEEYLLLSTLIAFPEKCEYVLSRLDVGDLRDAMVVSLFKRLVSLTGSGDLVRVLDQASEEEKQLVAKLSVAPGFDLEHVEKNIRDCIGRIKEKKLDEMIRGAETSGDLKFINSLLHEKKRFLKDKGT